MRHGLAFGEINDFGNYLATGWGGQYVGTLGRIASPRNSLLPADGDHQPQRASEKRRGNGRCPLRQVSRYIEFYLLLR